MAEEDARRTEEDRAARAVTRKLLRDSISAIGQTKLVPKGKKVVNPDGTISYECNEYTYGMLVDTVGKTLKLRNVLDGTDNKRPTVGVQVNVNNNGGGEGVVTPVVQTTPEETRRQAQAIEREFFPQLIKDYGEDAARKAIVSALTEAARLRA